MINLEQTTRDWSTDKHKQVRVSYAENYLSRTIDIHWETEDEFLKDTDDCQMIYTQ